MEIPPVGRTAIFIEGHMLPYLFVVVAVAMRFLPHAWSFTPVAASLLFFGAYASRRQMWFPVLLLAGSDVALSRLVYHYPITGDLFITWAWYAAAVAIGMMLSNRTTVARLVG